MSLEIPERAEELNPSVISMKFSQRAKNCDFKDLPNAQHEIAISSRFMNRLKLTQPPLNDIGGGRV